VVDQLEAKYDAARRASSWLTGRLEELRARLETSEAAVQSYMAQYQTGDSQGANITEQQIIEVTSRLTAARADRAAAEAKFRQAQQMVRTLGPAGAATSLASPLLISLRGQRAELIRREAELSNRYGPKHPTMIELRTKIRDVDGAISGEVGQIVTSLNNQVAEGAARVRALESELTGLESRAGGQAEAAVGLRQLEAEAEANRRIYNDFLQRLNETREQEGFQTADSRIIEPATPSWRPFVPRTKVSAALGGVAGGAFGLGILALMRMFARSFRTIAQVTEQTGLPVLASTPKVSRRRIRRLLRYLEQRPNSDLAESARYLRNSILGESNGNLRSALITSSFPDEGKSTLSIMLAEMMARMGKSVVLLDCDMRRPSLAHSLSMRPERDLVSLIEKRTELDETVISPAHGSFHLIPMKRGQAGKADLLASEQFSALMTELESSYDFVLIDAPPVLGVGDFSVLGKRVDTTVVVVQWDKTPATSFKRTLGWLRDNQIEVLGAVLSKVDRKREAQYDTATYGAEYASFRRYYTN
ncbi:MAG: AAA family ATPase, partial [Pseudomonadota bacterium]